MSETKNQKRKNFKINTIVVASGEDSEIFERTSHSIILNTSSASQTQRLALTLEELRELNETLTLYLTLYE